MDRFFYFLAVLVIVGYFLIPKISGIEPPQLYWQWQIDKLKYNFNGYKENGGLFKYLPKNVPITPQGAADFYQNALLDQLQILDNLELK